ncbi:protein dispatched homolog 3-like [Liolophura sinensis]|uniref:protein dispatched homolog 3-like n=1 Tax=Liolophura sinensis TaxID=3198878 RepID=UPI00315865BF
MEGPSSRQDCNQHEPKPIQEPCVIFKILVRFPVLCFLFALSFHLAVLATTIGLLIRGDDVFAFDFEQLPIVLNTETSHLRDLAWDSRNKYPEHLTRVIISRYMPWWPRGYAFDYVEMIYQHGDNILTPANLMLIQDIEERLYNNENYTNAFCQVKYDQTCWKPTSLLRFFDGSFKHIDRAFEDPTFSNVPRVLHKASYYNETKGDFRELVSADGVISETSAQSKVIRTRIPIGGPLTYSDGPIKEKPKYTNFLKNIFQPELEDIVETYKDKMDINYISNKLFRLDLNDQAFLDLRLAIGSQVFIFVYMLMHTESLWITFWACFSICTSFLGVNLFYRFALGYTYFGFFHLLSIFIILGIGADDVFIFYDMWRLNCTKTFPSDAHRLAATYRRATRSMLATSLTTMAAFLVSGLSPLLAVSTFGIFSGLLVLVNYISVITFFPTVVVVYSLRVLPLLCSGIDFVTGRGAKKTNDTLGQVNTGFQEISGRPALTYTPEKIMQNNLYLTETDKSNTGIGNYQLVANGHIRKRDAHMPTTDAPSGANGHISTKDAHMPKNGHIPTTDVHIPTTDAHVPTQSPVTNGRITTTNQPLTHVDDVSKSCANGACFFGNELPTGTGNSDNSPNASQNSSSHKIGHSLIMLRLTKFLKSTYYNLVTSLPAKIIVPVLFLAVFIVFLVYAIKLAPDKRQVRMFRSSHNYGRAQELRAYSFATNPRDLTTVKLVWGLQEADMSSCDFKSSKVCGGKPVFDPHFEFGSIETQAAVLRLCQRLRNLTDEQIDDLHIRRNLFTNQPEIACFMEAAQDFFWKEKYKKFFNGQSFYPENVTFDFPFTDEHMKIIVRANARIYPSLNKMNFTRPLEMALSYWLSRAWTQLASVDYYLYRGLIGEVTLNETRAFRNQRALSYNTGIKYFAVEVNTTMYVNTLGYQEGLPIYERWETLMNDLLKDLPYPLKRGFQLTGNTWHWLRIQQTLANAAIYGVAIGLSLALPILIVTTQNIIIGFVATLTIGCVTVCVIGMIPMAGWRLGVLESLNLCLVVGLSVDYVVHLAEAYHRCELGSREDRVRHMLETVGTAVLSGAITTTGASIFMLFAEIQFLLQFGVFMLTTIGFSILFSLLWFSVIMAVCGPQGRTGSLIALCRTCDPRKWTRNASLPTQEIPIAHGKFKISG